MPDPAPDPKHLNRLLLAAFVGLVLLIAWNVAFGQALPAGTRLDPRDAVHLPGATRIAAASEALLAVVTFQPDAA